MFFKPQSSITSAGLFNLLPRNHAASQRGRLMGLSLAVALAGPLAGFGVSPAWGQDEQAIPAVAVLDAPVEAPDLADADRLRQGIRQLQSDQYEDALVTLQAVNAQNLSERERRQLSESISRAESAANQRRAARAEFELGEQALAADNPAQALVHYRAAYNNRFADEATRAKARDQAAVAEAGMKQAAQNLRNLYDEAKEDYSGGNLAAAREKFQTLQTAGFRAPMFQRSPQDYIRDIDRRLASAPTAVEPGEPAAPPAVATVEPTATEPPPPADLGVTAMADPQAPAAESDISRDDARAAYRLGRRQYREGDYVNARQNLQIAVAGGYRSGLFEDPPQRLLARIDRAEAEAQARAQAEAQARAQVQPVVEPATAAPQVAAVPEDQTLRATAQMTALQRQQRQREAAALVERANAARAANRVDEALALYSSALELDPDNQVAMTARNELLGQAGLTPARLDPLDAVEARIRARRQEIQFRFNAAIDSARVALEANDFGSARAALDQARIAAGSDPNIFTPEETREFNAAIAATSARLQRMAEVARQQDIELAREQAAQRLEEAEARAARERRDTIADLVATSRRLVEQGRYQQALGVLDQILVLDPRNDYAIGVRPLVEDRALVREQRMYIEQMDRAISKQLNLAQEKMIPYPDILSFPPNWPDLTETREQSVAIERGEGAEDAAITAQLERRLPELRFDQVAFSDVVDFLRDVTGANIYVNWRALEQAGVERNSPVDARLRDVKFSKALELILSNVGGGIIQLGYTVDEGVITISTSEDLARNVITRVYDIRDLIVNVPDFEDAPDFNLQTGGGGGGGRGGRGGGGGGGGLFGGGGGGRDRGEEETLSRSELVESIIQLIEETVSPDSWRNQGGTIGSIRELAGQLIVTQTPENQRALVRLLEQLRETRAIQVTVEARFLFVQRNFLEDIGVDFDFAFNLNGPGTFSSPIVVNNNTANFTSAGNIDTTLPGNLSSAAVTGPSLVTGFTTFLDDFEAQLLIRATQMAQNSTQLTAPRITLFNGQRAYVLVATQRAYVSDLTPVVGAGAVGFDPEIEVIESGVMLDVQATVSADRKYVTLTLRPQLARLLALVPFAFGSSQVTGGGGTGAGPTTQLFGVGIVQQPELQITEVRTSVSVPDGGTLLLGGQTLSGEVEREAGVPILSKIPFLKRLFTNRSMARDDQILLILVRPTIIIQREREQEQFPLLQTRVAG